jgi:hypothetical protein
MALPAFAPLEYLSSWLDGRKQRDLFRDVRAYCMFIGYPRSGHTLTGALLNAHPDAVVAHELDALGYVQRGFSREQIYALLLKRDQWFTNNGSRWHEFSYEVAGQWQGRFRELKVIGDKRGGGSSRRLTQSPQLLDRLRQTVRVPLRVIHAVRNPYDNIATIARRNECSLEDAAKSFFRRAETNLRAIETSPPGEIVTLRHEDFVAQPRRQLQELVRFIGLEADDAYLDACGKLVFESPKKSRNQAQWNDAVRASIQARIERIPFLRGYRFED